MGREIVAMKEEVSLRWEMEDSWQFYMLPRFHLYNKKNRPPFLNKNILIEINKTTIYFTFKGCSSTFLKTVHILKDELFNF